MVLRIDPRPDGLMVALHPNDRGTVLSWRWLRDHGEDPETFNHETGQRRIDALGPVSAVTGWKLDAVDGDPALTLTWTDKPASTWISVATIVRLMSDPGPLVAEPWNSAEQVSLSVGDIDKVLGTSAGLTEWLNDLATWGVAKLSGFDGSSDQAIALADRIGYVRTSIFGGLWDLASDIADHDDTAYTESFLAPHTDGTYSHDAPGLQMFCCTHRDGTGGESIIVDGFAIAGQIRSDRPDLFETLTTVEVPAHYIEPSVELRASRPAIRLDANGHVVQVSLNNYDRSPMLLPPGEMDRFYEAYGLLQSMADDESRWLSIRLEAGDVLINDNWRVLHGRQAYTGERRFIGCYLNHEDFESRLRTLA